jgi:poly-gamma-glutamate synthesis protein (capsule biosynthesis protein)
MNFKVVVRTLFLVLVLSTAFLIIYANTLDNKAEPGNTLIAQTATEDEADLDENVIAQQDETIQEESTEPEDLYVKENVVITVSALGDVALGQDWRFKPADAFDYVFEKQNGDYSYFFKNVADILSKDDLTIANLETSLCTQTKTAEKYDYGNNYWFRGRPEFANILRAGNVEVANLANNHTYDYGQAGYDETINAIKDAGVEYFGYSDVLYKEVKGIKVGMVGFNQLGNYEQGLDMDEFKQEVTSMLKDMRGKCDFLIANFHWGKEYKYQQNETQTELGHLAVDSGADLVIGNHPHVLQPVEEYEGKYIIYSLGNFCFGGRKTFDDYDTAIYQQSFTFDSDNVLQIVSEPTIIPCSVCPEKYNNYQPSIATGEQAVRVYKKLNLRMPEKEPSELADTDMVRVDKYIDNILVELRYAGSNNVFGKPVYESDICYLRKGTADKLVKANETLLKQGYMIKVWDGYRPLKYQKYMHDNAPVKAVFLDPAKGYSNHTRGAAVDCTLATLDGKKVDMPTDFDDGTAKAYRTYDKCTEAQKKNALILENAMKDAGFYPINNEWWHFDDTECKNYEPLEEYQG